MQIILSNEESIELKKDPRFVAIQKTLSETLGLSEENFAVTYSASPTTFEPSFTESTFFDDPEKEANTSEVFSLPQQTLHPVIHITFPNKEARSQFVKAYKETLNTTVNGGEIEIMRRTHDSLLPHSVLMSYSELPLSNVLQIPFSVLPNTKKHLERFFSDFSWNFSSNLLITERNRHRLELNLPSTVERDDSGISNTTPPEEQTVQTANLRMSLV